ncbi:lytic transglycosylase domain-containing protein [Belnapia sp. F-4-1]|uniref:lytic transglycosylase domain-containing protein n=1 Tax=Belnapia sp. F-4-1 TaxID=1545443 RepID=UPI000690D5F9|nr:lytic transglycosylase domain-containing protein [Belnapia sp. F-4-1]
MPCYRLLFVLALLLLPLPATATPNGLCEAAITTVEREAGLPPRLLAAIARVESGRRDPATGTLEPWPWTINAEGRGSFFPDKAAAIAAVRSNQAQGVRSIDIGCMQINLRHHPNAFASLAEAFDPLANVRYAARFLKELKSTRADWMAAAAAYHSQTPEHAKPYRARVAAAWAQEQARPAPAPQVALPLFRPSQPGGGFMLSNGADRASVLANANPGSGRGLSAYRAAPIPLAGRMVMLPPRL